MQNMHIQVYKYVDGSILFEHALMENMQENQQIIL
jgi:hypothetical protein